MAVCLWDVNTLASGSVNNAGKYRGSCDWSLPKNHSLALSNTIYGSTAQKCIFDERRGSGGGSVNACVCECVFVLQPKEDTLAVFTTEPKTSDGSGFTCARLASGARPGHKMSPGSARCAVDFMRTERNVGPRAAELHLPARGAFTVHGRLDANAMRQGNLYSNKREYSIREG
ncbi:unnamed protein product [Leuciscus chuanchicus]